MRRLTVWFGRCTNRYSMLAILSLVPVGAAALEEGEQASEPGSMPEWVVREQTSDDPTYGYSTRNPIKVGGPSGFSKPASEKLYLRHLLDKNFKRFSFRRIGSITERSECGHVLDAFALTDSEGNDLTLYIDMYHTDVHPFDVKAPKGTYFFK